MSEYEKTENSEWKIDPTNGKRFRMIGNIQEYEQAIFLSSGIEIPESQLKDYHERQRKEKERRRAEALATLKNRPVPKNCPFANSAWNTTCKCEKCTLFIENNCVFSVVADNIGTETEEQIDKTKKCPLGMYAHCEKCALYNNGCAFIRIANATLKK